MLTVIGILCCAGLAVGNSSPDWLSLHSRLLPLCGMMKSNSVFSYTRECTVCLALDQNGSGRDGKDVNYNRMWTS